MRHCPSCGTRTDREALEDYSSLRCPRCVVPFEKIAVGGVEMLECSGCGGAWVAPGTFERICAEHEVQQSIVAYPRAPEPQAAPATTTVRYLPCPQCGKHMNRVNFARCSGIIMDVCKEHGTYFDRHELHGIVQFISGGGLDIARNREKERLAEERQRIRIARLDLERDRRKAHAAYAGQFRRGDDIQDLLSEMFGIGF